MASSDRLLNDASTGLASSTEFTENMQDIEDVILAATGGMVVSGAIPTVVSGLTLRVPISVYDIGIERTKASTDIALTNNATNRVFAVTDPDDSEGIVYVVKTDTTVPSRSALRAIAVTSGGAITSITETPGNKKRRSELGLHTVTLDQYINTAVPVNSDLLLKWDFSAKGSFPLQDYQVVIDPDDIDQLPTSTLVFVLPVRETNYFYLYIQNLTNAAAGGYGTAAQIRLTPKLVGRGYSLTSETGVDVITPSAVNYSGDAFSLSGASAGWILVASGANAASFEAPGTSVLRRGTYAAIPAATSVPAGTIYFATDRFGGTPFRSTGSAWEQIAAGVNSDIAAIASLANGDLITRAAGAFSRLAIGTTDEKILSVTSGAPVWKDRARGYGYYMGIGSTIDRWHASDRTGTQGLTTQALAVDIIYALPFVVERGGTIDRLGFNLTTAGAAGSVSRIGVYKAVSYLDFYPDAVQADSGSIATDGATGAKTYTLSLVLDPNTLYYLCILVGVAGCTVASLQSTNVLNLIGYSNTLSGTPGALWQVASAYGALPATFPAGASASNTRPAVFCRFSA